MSRLLCVSTSVCFVLAFSCRLPQVVPDNPGTDPKIVHFGCAERDGATCTEQTDQGSCEAAENCRFEFGQCLPDGRGCPGNQGRESCESLPFCHFKTWRDPCLWRCELNDSPDGCDADPACAWQRRRDYCGPQAAVECANNRTREACEAVDSRTPDLYGAQLN
jgi:hypothetical protein